MRAVIASLLVALSVMAICHPVQADRRGGLRLDTPFLAPGRDAPNRDVAPRGMTPNEAARRAQAENGGGRVLSVEPSGSGYRVKLLRDGEVRVVYVQ